MVGPEVIQEMEDQMQSISQRIKEAQDHKKSYVDVHHIDHSYEVGDKLLLRMNDLELDPGARWGSERHKTQSAWNLFKTYVCV
jgi:predicted glycoside hydrolase/deacetylase ChbG (UPF0249 family)